MEKLTGNRMNTEPSKNAYPPAIIQQWYNKLWEFEKISSSPHELRKVVVCRDCKHVITSSPCGWFLCRRFGRAEVEDDDYCSYFEPREERE